MADGPINYDLGVQQTPLGAFAGGYSVGAGIRDDQQQQRALQASQQQAIQQHQALVGLINNPNAGARDYANATLLMPQLKDQFKQAWDMKNTDQQDSALRNAGQALAAITSGRPDVAVQQMQARADAMQKAGASPQEIQTLRTYAQLIDAHPELGRALIGTQLASFGEPGAKVLSALSTAGTEQRAADKAPAELIQANAKAGIDTVAANNAPTKTALENANSTEDIATKQSQREIAALNTQIAQANSETDRGKLILQRDELVQKQAEAVQTKAATTQSKLDKLDESLQTVDRIMKHPGLEKFMAFGGPGSYTGKIAAAIPGSDRKDLQGLVDTLQAQQFLTGVQNLVGMGALSDAEGKKIGSAVASLDLDQSAGAFKNALGVIQTNLRKAQNNALASPTVPTTGGGFVMKVPQFGNVTEGDINRIMKNNPGSTREQALQYLSSLGKK